MPIFNVLTEDREGRCVMLDHTESGGGRHLHTTVKVVKMCGQLIAKQGRYSWGGTEGTSRRGPFKAPSKLRTEQPQSDELQSERSFSGAEDSTHNKWRVWRAEGCRLRI